MTTQTVPPTQAGATLQYDGKSMTLPLVRGTENETAIDIEKLRAQTGLITMDPGYGNTGACKSAITFIAITPRAASTPDSLKAAPPHPLFRFSFHPRRNRLPARSMLSLPWRC